MLHSPISKDTIDLGRCKGIDVYHPFLINKTFSSRVCETFVTISFLFLPCYGNHLPHYSAAHPRRLRDFINAALKTSDPLLKSVSGWKVYTVHGQKIQCIVLNTINMAVLTYPKLPDFRKSIAVLI